MQFSILVIVKVLLIYLELSDARNLVPSAASASQVQGYKIVLSAQE